MPSKAKRKSFLKLHFVLPKRRSSTTKGTPVFLKPIQA